MPRIFRFGLLVVCLAVAYAAAGALAQRDLPRFADAAVLLGCFVFAGAIALVGQTYHLAGEFADAILLWLAGTLLAAFATRSVSATVLATAGTAYWLWLVTYDHGVAPHWGGLAAVFLCGALAVWLDSRLARVSSILALGFWIVCTGLQLDLHNTADPADITSIFIALALALWTAGLVLATLRTIPRLAALGHDLQMPALASFLASAAILQIAFDVGDGPAADGVWIAVAGGFLVLAIGLGVLAWQRGALRAFDVAALAVLGWAALGLAAWSPDGEYIARLSGGVLVILIALWWVSLGHEGHVTGSRIGLLAFGAEVLYLYGVTLGTLLDTALAFFAGGILFIGLSVLLFRFNRKLVPEKAAS